jgi:hypothetical protein
MSWIKRMAAECAILAGLLICASPINAQVQQTGNVTAGHVVTWNSDHVIQDGGAVTANDSLSGGSTTSIAAGATDYCATAGCASSAAIASTVPFTGTAVNLKVSLGAAPGTGHTVTATLYTGPYGTLAATTVTCTISNAATSCSDTTHQVNIASGQAWAIQLVVGAGATSTSGQTFGLQFISSAPAQPTSPYVLQSGNITSGHAVGWITNGVIGDAGVPINNTIAPGPFTSGDIVYVNNLLQLADSGVPLTAASITVGTSVISGGTSNGILYDNAGILGNIAGANGVLVTDGSQNPSISSTLPSALTIPSPTISSPALTGVPTAPTATVGTNTTQVATTAFVLANSSSCTSAGAFPVGTGSAAQCSTTANSTATLAGGPLTINSTALSTTQGLLVTQSSPTSGSSVGPLNYNRLNITNTYNATGGGSVDGASNTNIAGLRVDFYEHGTNIGASQSAGILSHFHITTAAVNGSDKQAIIGFTYGNVTDSGAGGWVGVVGEALADTGATATLVEGMEADAGVNGTATKRWALGIGNVGTGHGSTIDAAILVESFASGGEFNNLIYLSNSAGNIPLSTTANFFAADTAYTVANVFNLPTMTITGNFANFANFEIGGNGRAAFGTNPGALSGTTIIQASCSSCGTTIIAAGTNVATGFGGVQSVTSGGANAFSLYASEAARTVTAFGITSGNWVNLTVSGASNNGMLFGTLSNTPIVFGTNNVEGMRLGNGLQVGSGLSDPGAGSVNIKTLLGVGGVVPSNTTVLITGNATSVAGNVGSLPTPLLQLVAANSAVTAINQMGFAAGPNYNFSRADGTAASPTAVTTNDIIGAYGAYGFDGTNYDIGAAIAFIAMESFTSTHNGTAIRFTISPVGGTAIIGGWILPSGGLDLSQSSANDPGAGGIYVSGQSYLPNITQTSAAQTGTVCWSSGSSPVGKLTVDTTLACLSSSARWKQDIREWEDAALPLVARLHPSLYEWRHPIGDNQQGDQLGLIAEQVWAVDHRLAGLGEDGKPRAWRQDAMITLALKAIQELKADNDNLRTEIAQIRKASGQ